jgi:hypothetical protein
LKKTKIIEYFISIYFPVICKSKDLKISGLKNLKIADYRRAAILKSLNF